MKSLDLKRSATLADLSAITVLSIDSSCPLSTAELEFILRMTHNMRELVIFDHDWQFLRKLFENADNVANRINQQVTISFR